MFTIVLEFNVEITFYLEGAQKKKPLYKINYGDLFR